MENSSYLGGVQSSGGGNVQQSAYMTTGGTRATNESSRREGSVRGEYPILRPPSTINVTLRETTTGGLTGDPPGMCVLRCGVPPSSGLPGITGDPPGVGMCILRRDDRPSGLPGITGAPPGVGMCILRRDVPTSSGLPGITRDPPGTFSTRCFGPPSSGLPEIIGNPTGMCVLRCGVPPSSGLPGITGDPPGTFSTRCFTNNGLPQTTGSGNKPGGGSGSSRGQNPTGGGGNNSVYFA